MDRLVLDHLVWFLPLGLVGLLILAMFAEAIRDALFPAPSAEPHTCERCGAADSEPCHDFTSERRRLCPRRDRRDV